MKKSADFNLRQLSKSSVNRNLRTGRTWSFIFWQGSHFRIFLSLRFHLPPCCGADDVPRNCRRAPQRRTTWALLQSSTFRGGMILVFRFFITMATPATTARRRSPPTAPPTAAIITVVLSDVSEELSDLSEELVETDLVVSLLVVAASGGGGGSVHRAAWQSHPLGCTPNWPLTPQT